MAEDGTDVCFFNAFGAQLRLRMGEVFGGESLIIVVVQIADSSPVLNLFGLLVEMAGKRFHRAAHVKRMNNQMFFVSCCRQKCLGLFQCQFHIVNNPFVQY